MRRWALIVGAVTVSSAFAFGALGDLFILPDDPAINYAGHPVRNAVAELNRKIQEGTVQLKFDGDQGYLRSVLDALKIPIESQVVAFSKTSVQSLRINPQNPRTLFFNDSVVVGWVRGGFIELAAQDPGNGVIFYTLSQSVQS